MFRTVAAAVATTAIAALCGIAIPLAASPTTSVPGIASAVAGDVAPADQPFASGDGTGPIAPGVELLTEFDDGTASCTANFVYSAGDRVFLGSAAHCHAEESLVDGCANGSLPLGTPVTIRGFDGEDYPAELAYSSWLTMQEVGETDEETCALNDFALLEIATDDVDRVDPSVPVFGGPEGLDGDGVEEGEQVFSYQNDTDDPLPTMRAKQGMAVSTYESGRAHLVVTTTPGLPGDSGSGYLDRDGNAIGVLSTVFELEDGEVANDVTDIALALEYAAENSDVGAVSLVEGTERFAPDGASMDPLPVAPRSSWSDFLKRLDELG